MRTVFAISFYKKCRGVSQTLSSKRNSKSARFEITKWGVSVCTIILGFMSNTSIKERIWSDLADLVESPDQCVAFSRAFEMNVEALERLPSTVRTQGINLALDILHKSYDLEENLVVDLDPEIEGVQDWLSKVPE